MKLIIDLPEEIYIEKKEDYIGDTLDKAIANGIPLEEKTGHWIPTDELEEIYAEMFTCSNCHYSDFMAEYCPHCGAKMDNYSEDY